MEAMNVAVIGQQQLIQHRRNLSDSTMASSAAEEHKRQLEKQMSLNEKHIGIQNNQILLNVQDNDFIHLGPVVHHHYHRKSQVSQPEFEKAETSPSRFTETFPSKKKWRLTVRLSHVSRCAKASFVITGMAVIATVTISILLMNLASSEDPDFETTTTMATTTTAQDFSNFLVQRREWQASRPKMGIKRLQAPATRIIVAHTGGGSCSDFESCKSRVKAIQDENGELDDIPFNFLVGGDGRVYVGRGFGFEGQHTANRDATEYNSIGICVAFVGNYSTVEPSEEQLGIFRDFVGHFRGNGSIANDYIVVLQDDLKYSIVVATQLNMKISAMEHFYPLQRVFRREEWFARWASKQTEKFDEVKDWVLISHTASGNCSNLGDCSSILRNLQAYNMDNLAWPDIGYNFFVGGGGLVFEARGWDIIGSHTNDFNHLAVGITAIGTFHELEPSQGMLDAFLKLMDDAAALGKLKVDYEVSARRDVPGGAGPGDGFMKYLVEWCRYRNRSEPCS